MNSTSPCRTYIVYRNALFAQGVRSVLEGESAVQIVGMADDLAKATAAVRALNPEVILMEEPMESGVAWPFLEWANASRIVTFSLHHAHATVYDSHRAAADDTSDLVQAIQGTQALEEVPDARTDARAAMASTPDRLTADEPSQSGRIDPASPPESSRVRKVKNRDPSRNASATRTAFVDDTKE